MVIREIADLVRYSLAPVICTFDGTGTASLLYSKGVSSLTDTGTGLFDLTLTSPLSSVNAPCFGTGDTAQRIASVDVPDTSTLRVVTAVSHLAGAVSDIPHASIFAFDAG